MSADEFDFDDLTPIRIPVKYRRREYVLVEATEAVKVKYRNATMRAARMSDGKMVGVDGMADAEPILVAGCLRELRDGKEVGVTVQQVLEWQGHVVEKLFLKAQEISQLNDSETQDTLRKKISELQAKLKKLQEDESFPKGGRGSTSPSSGSQPASDAPSESSSDGEGS